MDKVRQIVRNRVLYRIPVYGQRLEIKHKVQAKDDARMRKYERQMKLEDNKHPELNINLDRVQELQKRRNILRKQNWWCELEGTPGDSKILGVRFYTEDPNWETNITPERLEWIKLNVETIQYCDDFWTIANKKFDDIQSDFIISNDDE